MTSGVGVFAKCASQAIFRISFRIFGKSHERTKRSVADSFCAASRQEYMPDAGPQFGMASSTAKYLAYSFPESQETKILNAKGKRRAIEKSRKVVPSGKRRKALLRPMRDDLPPARTAPAIFALFFAGKYSADKLL